MSNRNPNQVDSDRASLLSQVSPTDHRGCDGLDTSMSLEGTQQAPSMLPDFEPWEVVTAHASDLPPVNCIARIDLVTCETDGPPPWSAWHNSNDPTVGFLPYHRFPPFTAMCPKHKKEETLHQVAYGSVAYKSDPLFQMNFDPSVGFPNKNVASLPVSAFSKQESSAGHEPVQPPPYSRDAQTFSPSHIKTSSASLDTCGDTKVDDKPL
jgi:hypothetical protein